MTDQVRQQVLDYLLGALDDSEMEAVKARIESDTAYRQAIEQARHDMVRLADLARVEGLKRELAPPQLAKRTCDFLFNPAKRLRTCSRRRVMTPVSVEPRSGGRLNWADVGVASVILLIAGLLVIPAVNGARFQARVNACQDNLRQVGQALTDYSHRNSDAFPAVPTDGNLSAAGVYAPILTEEGYLTESDKLLCPDSLQAEKRDFRVPTLEEVKAAVGQQLASLRETMGGSYGYDLGYFDHGVYQTTRNLNRDYFALMADAPSNDRPDHQSMNHGGLGQNVLFEDLHIEFCSTARPGDGRDDIYCNDNRQVAPGMHRDDAVIASSGTSPVFFISLP